MRANPSAERAEPVGRLSGGVLAERPVDVGGRQHAVDPAVRLDEEVLLGRASADREDQVLARDGRRAASAPPPSCGRPSRPPPRDAARPGIAVTAASLTMPTGVPSAVTVTMLPASASCARRTASAERQVLGDGERTPRERARDEGGQPLPQPGVRHRGGRAGPEEQAEDERRGRSRGWSGGDADDRLLDQRPGRAAASAVRRPPQPATMVPRCWSPEAPQTDGLEHPAAVERQPGHEVEHADQQVGAARRPSIATRTSPSGTGTRPDRGQRRPRSR